MWKKVIVGGIVGLVITLLVLSSVGSVVGAKATAWDRDISNPGYEHGPAVDIDGTDYYFVGPGSIKGFTDVPGHTWVQAGPNKVLGKHFNVGPWMAPSGTPRWARDEPYGALLYK